VCRVARVRAGELARTGIKFCRKRWESGVGESGGSGGGARERGECGVEVG
jgi:hypothetical protein